MRLFALLSFVLAALLAVVTYRKLPAGSGWAALFETALGMMGAVAVDFVARLSTPPLLPSAHTRIAAAAAGGLMLATMARWSRRP